MHLLYSRIELFIAEYIFLRIFYILFHFNILFYISKISEYFINLNKTKI